MSIFHNGKEYGATKVINYSASPDYNRGVAVTNIQDGNYQATDNGFLLIELQSQQSNVTKVSVIRSQNPITDNTGTEIASIVLSQYQYSETLIAQVMAREYYKLIIEGVGNPQVLNCVFYPYASTVPIKLTENITMEQVEGLGELAVVDNVDLTTQTTGVLPVNKGGTGANNIDNARKNLQTFTQVRLSNNSDLNDVSLFLKNNIHIYRNGDNCNNRPHKVNTGQVVTYLDPLFNRGWQRFYPAGISENGHLGYWGRVYSSNVWGEWKLMRNQDGSIPADLIPPTQKVYTTTEGTWVETTLNDGSVLLEGYGYFLGNKELKSKYISLPKTCKEHGGVYGSVIVSNIFGLFSYYSALTSAGYGISSTEFMIVSDDQVSLMGVSWIFKGILA